MVTPTLEELEALVGWTFPGGSYTLDRWRSWLTNDVLLAAQADYDTDGDNAGLAHPMFCYYAAMAGMGISINGLFAMASASADDGPMFGEADMELRKPMRVGTTYTVRGEITGVKRKEGARTGTFDILSFRLEVVEPNGEVAGVMSNSFIFPRRNP